MNIPIVGKEYNCFDDGKVRPSRLYSVVVKEVIPFNEIDKEPLVEWEEQVNDCYWLFSTHTDYFVIAYNFDDEKEVFARTKSNGWFSLVNFLSGGLLDANGNLTEAMYENYPEYKEELESE